MDILDFLQARYEAEAALVAPKFRLLNSLRQLHAQGMRGDAGDTALETCRSLAAEYADHPEFRTEWRIDVG